MGPNMARGWVADQHLPKGWHCKNRRMDYRAQGLVKDQPLPEEWQFRTSRMDYRAQGWVEDQFLPKGWKANVKSAHQGRLNRRRF